MKTYIVKNVNEDWINSIVHLSIVEVPDDIHKDDYLKNLALFDGYEETYQLSIEDFDKIREITFQGKQNFPEDMVGKILTLELIQIINANLN